MKTPARAILLASFFVGLCGPTPTARAELGDCGQPISDRAAPAASVALRLLSYVTGLRYALSCGLYGVTTTSTSTTSTSTTTLPAATWSDVLEIFARHSCTLSGCHGGVSSAGDLSGLDNFDSGHVELLDEPLSCTGSLYGNRVVPVDPDSSFLVAKLEGFYDCGSPMPLAELPLNLQELDAVRSWILSGAPKN